MDRPTVFGNNKTFGTSDDFADLFDHVSLFLSIKTHGLLHSEVLLSQHRFKITGSLREFQGICPSGHTTLVLSSVAIYAGFPLRDIKNDTFASGL